MKYHQMFLMVILAIYCQRATREGISSDCHRAALLGTAALGRWHSSHRAWMDFESM